jgi:hypothetical protein
MNNITIVILCQVGLVLLSGNGCTRDSLLVQQPVVGWEIWFVRHIAVVDFVDGPALVAGQDLSIYAGRDARAPGAKPCGSVLEFPPPAVSSWKQLVGERGFEPPTPGPEPDCTPY